MILVDTGPLVALFDPRDSAHDRARRSLKSERGPFVTTLPVLTEAFHLLSPSSPGSRALRALIAAGGLTVAPLDAPGLSRAFELMDTYADHPMDLADASLVVAAERLGTRRILTLDRRDFATYRVLHGHRRLAFRIVRC